jgi:uncharacterized membrane protein YkoI
MPVLASRTRALEPGSPKTLKRPVATPRSMLSPMRRPMYRSTLKSGFKARLRTALALSIVAALLSAVPRSTMAAETLHCLTGDEQRTAIANNKAVPLATAIHALHRAPKDVIKAQLCQEPERLIYMLTLLGRDGKVKRATVDATNGAVVGER